VLPLLKENLSQARLCFYSNIESVEHIWRHLERDTAVSVHQSYDWCKAWVEAHGNPLLIIGGMAGEPSWLLPLEILRQGPFRIARYIGADFSNLNTGIVPDPERATIKLLLERNHAELKAHADIILLENMADGWREKANPLAGAYSVRNQNSSYQLTLKPSFEDTLAQLDSQKKHKRFRASERKLKALGGYQHGISVRGDAAHQVLDEFFRQKHARLVARGLPDVFSDLQVREFFHLLLEHQGTSSQAAFELHWLKAHMDGQEKVLAIAGLSRKGDHVICQFGSVDDTAAPTTSPGEALFYLIIQQLCREQIKIFDFGIGDQPYKRAWCNVETPQFDYMIPLTQAGKAFLQLHRLKTVMKRRIKENPKIYQLVQSVSTRVQGDEV
jgi:CelD/BcsL family acetyltransferase involved in cellulose biosynthesis